MESYKHKAAKETLRGWIDNDPKLLFRGLMARINEWKDVLPALSEFPITSVSTGRDKWGAVTARAFQHGDGTLRSPQPPYAELRHAGFNVYAILDIGVVNGNRELRYGFEVVHRCPVSPEKGAFLDTLRATTCEISAEWVLCQIEPPLSLQVNRIFGHEFWVDWQRELDLKHDGLGGAVPPARSEQ